MTGSAYHLVPWTHVVRPHEDIVSGALDMGVYAVNLARVFRGGIGIPPVYQHAGEFHAATYLTDKMRELFADVASALSGAAGSRVLQLRTPFGGGKSHSLVGLLHLVRDRAASVVGNPDLVSLPDPGSVQLVVLSGEELDRHTPMRTNGVTSHTLWGEMAAQLGRYELVEEHDRTGAAPGGAVLRQMLGDSPVLILLDEVLVYVEKAMAIREGDSNAGRQAMLFVQALTEAVNNHPKAVMVYSLQASVGEAVGAEGLLTDLDHLVGRVDAKREPVSGDEVLRVVQRRLFASLGDEQVQAQVAEAYASSLEKHLLASAETAQGRREAVDSAEHLRRKILTSYPFHPDLLDLMNFRWGSLPNYQRTRGALQFLACTVHALWNRGAITALIGPGDVDLSDEATRSAFFTQVGERERYSSVLAADITSSDCGAAIVDRRLSADSPAIAQMAVGTRVAAAAMLYSFGARDGEERGVLGSDLIASVLAPGLDRNVVAAALADLQEEELYLHRAGRRFRFEPVPNLTKLLRDTSNSFGGEDVLAEIRTEFEDQFKGVRGVSIWPADPGAIVDERPVFTLAYLHPDWSGTRLPLSQFVEYVSRGRLRSYRNGLALVLPESSQFDRVRQATRSRMAADHLLGSSKHRFNAEQLEELALRRDSARRDGAAALTLAYRTVVLPVRDRTGERPYRMEEIDLRSLVSAGRSLQERVFDALSSRVFSTITPSKLVSLGGLGPEKELIPCAELVDCFFSYYEFVKIRDKGVIADAIARAVSNGDAGYVVGLTRSNEKIAPRDRRAVRFELTLRPDEVDLSEDAAIMSADYARSLLKPEQSSDDENKTQGNEVDQGPALPHPIDNPATRPTDIRSTLTRQHDTVRTAQISAHFDRSGLFRLVRALSKLRDVDARVEVDVKLRVEGELDRAEFRNSVIEPIDEDGHDVDIQRAFSILVCLILPAVKGHQLTN
ncbi:hypothetical protein ACG83_39605 [Frankia sp. R43]|uniref:ATP-binding protein n=1 Tax=Frankia sp. R43 TaxID=269536 RepID=UPI0006CA4F4D|nr:DUF499 domain-containing protein [Frankia sp. R43]KPM50639.1 hypothetical protein ACG83_39605 [Frankia sp. R43]